MKYVKITVATIIIVLLSILFIAGCANEKQVLASGKNGYVIEYPTGTPYFYYVIDTLTNNVYLARYIYSDDYEFTLLYNDDGTIMRANDILDRIKVAMEKD